MSIIFGIETIGVDEIEIGRMMVETRKRRMGRAHAHTVPTHMRDTLPFFVARKRGHTPRHPAKAGRGAEFQACLSHELHADAYAEKRPSRSQNDLLEGLDHAVESLEALFAGGEGA